MTIQPDEAARALKDAEAAATRSTTAVSYQRISGYLILWGLIWFVANLLAFFKAPYGSQLWALLMTTGVVGSYILGRRSERSGSRQHALHSLLIAMAMFLFSFGVQAVTGAASFAEAEAIICLGMGATYMAMGTSSGLRMSAVGAAVMIAVIVGWLYARDQFFLWMALAGGGALILGGVWLRKA